MDKSKLKKGLRLVMMGVGTYGAFCMMRPYANLAPTKVGAVCTIVTAEILSAKAGVLVADQFVEFIDTIESIGENDTTKVIVI